MKSISELPNLGPKTETWLNTVGIFSREDVERIGSVEIYRLLRANGFPASLNLVYAIEAMIIGEHWTKLPPSLKTELREAVRNISK